MCADIVPFPGYRRILLEIKSHVGEEKPVYTLLPSFTVYNKTIAPNMNAAKPTMESVLAKDAVPGMFAFAASCKLATFVV